MTLAVGLCEAAWPALANASSPADEVVRVPGEAEVPVDEVRGVRATVPAGARPPGVTSALPAEVLAARPRVDEAAAVPVASAAMAWPDEVRAEVDEVVALRARGAYAAATLRFVELYERLATHPRRHLDALHAVVADTVNTAALAYRREHARMSVCVAQALLVRHEARVAALGRTTPAFMATLESVREELDARLAARGQACPGRPAARGEPGEGDMLLAPGRLSADVRVRRVATAERRWHVARRGGLVMMVAGMMALGGGLGIGAIEDLRRRDALQAGLFIGGTALFVGGLPLMVIGEQRTRALLAAGPTGVAIKF